MMVPEEFLSGSASLVGGWREAEGASSGTRARALGRDPAHALAMGAADQPACQRSPEQGCRRAVVLTGCRLLGQWSLVGLAHAAALWSGMQLAPRLSEVHEPIIQASLLSAPLPSTPPQETPAPAVLPKPRPVRVVPTTPPPPSPPEQQVAPAPEPLPAPLLTAAATAAADTSLVSASQAPAVPVHQAAPTAPPPAPLIEPLFNADYLDNPEPIYPALSRRLGERGRVVLRVRVSAQGQAEVVDIKTSSGHERLDQAARETVLRWRFVPARRGQENLAAWVLVPISFVM